MQTELEVKQQLLAQEFEYDKQLAQIKANVELSKEKDVEDRKDKRVRIQGTQQSELITQRQNAGLPQDFEQSEGLDINLGEYQGDLNQVVPSN